MIAVFTGNGKGKTTTSLGHAMRALGQGRRVLMIQFIKGPWKSGEDIFVKNLKNQISKIKEKGAEDLIEGLENLYDFDIRKMGLGFVGILGDTLPREAHEKAAHEAITVFSKELAGGAWDMIILDEVNVAVSLNLVTVANVLKAIELVPEEKIVILTGRDAPQEFIDRADLVTEMKEVKHPFQDGKKAKISFEF